MIGVVFFRVIFFRCGYMDSFFIGWLIKKKVWYREWFEGSVVSGWVGKSWLYSFFIEVLNFEVFSFVVLLKSRKLL